MKPAESAVRVLKWVTPVSLVEIGVVHWLLPWAWARYVLGLYGAVWLLGFYQTFRRRSPGAARWTPRRPCQLRQPGRTGGLCERHASAPAIELAGS